MLGTLHYPHFNSDEIGSERLAEPGSAHGCSLPLTTMLHTTYTSVSTSHITMILYPVLQYPVDSWGKATESWGFKVRREIRSHWGGDGSPAMSAVGLKWGWIGRRPADKLSEDDNPTCYWFPILRVPVRPQKHICYFLIYLHLRILRQVNNLILYQFLWYSMITWLWDKQLLKLQLHPQALGLLLRT